MAPWAHDDGREETAWPGSVAAAAADTVGARKCCTVDVVGCGWPTVGTTGAQGAGGNATATEGGADD